MTTTTKEVSFVSFETFDKLAELLEELDQLTESYREFLRSGKPNLMTWNQKNEFDYEYSTKKKELNRQIKDLMATGN